MIASQEYISQTSKTKKKKQTLSSSAKSKLWEIFDTDKVDADLLSNTEDIECIYENKKEHSWS